MHGIRCLLFNLGMALTAVLFSLLGVLLLPAPHTLRYQVVSRWARFNLWSLKVLCRLDYRVEGLEHLPAGPAVVLAKHQSTWETLAVQAFLPPITFVLKRELLFIPFFGWGLKALKPIAIDRKAGRKALMQVINQGKARLAQGLWVVIFPEGTRMAVGSQGTYNVGGTKLALDAGVPIVPVAHNAGVFWPRHSWDKRPGTISVVIGPVIETAGRKLAEVNREVEAWIEGQVATLPSTPEALPTRE